MNILNVADRYLISIGIVHILLCCVNKHFFNVHIVFCTHLEVCYVFVFTQSLGLLFLHLSLLL